MVSVIAVVDSMHATGPFLDRARVETYGGSGVAAVQVTRLGDVGDAHVQGRPPFEIGHPEGVDERVRIIHFTARRSRDLRTPNENQVGRTCMFIKTLFVQYSFTFRYDPLNFSSECDLKPQDLSGFLTSRWLFCNNRVVLGRLETLLRMQFLWSYENASRRINLWCVCIRPFHDITTGANCLFFSCVTEIIRENCLDEDIVSSLLSSGHLSAIVLTDGFPAVRFELLISV